MEIKARLESELKDAMRNNDDVRRRTIRMILTSMKLAEVEKGAPLEENAILAILQKEIKSRRESAREAQSASRLDLVQDAAREIAVVESFLPKQLDQQELLRLVQDTVAEVGASSAADMGKVMKVLLPKLRGRAAGDQVSLVVRQILQKS
ncbi:MAG: GatB/YqeY domain-containing protein [Anaerolineaceae bacterium]|nr:GatB/YqeY domain-containing protein [Anaerolineaceae bacterium]